MDRILYVVSAGAKQVSEAQTLNSNNLANVSTAGFQADLMAFTSVPVYGAGNEGRVFPQAQGTGVDFSRGPLQTTGNPLDVAVNGEGLIAIQAPDGSEAYTRAGDLRISSGGILVNGAGHPVLGDGGPIAVPPYEKLEIGSDGTVSVLPIGQEATNLAVLDRIKLVKPDHVLLAKGEDGLLRLREPGVADADASVSLLSGSLEASNVNAVESMVSMIELARMFEMQLKVMETARENDAASARLMQMS